MTTPEKLTQNLGQSGLSAEIEEVLAESSAADLDSKMRLTGLLLAVLYLYLVTPIKAARSMWLRFSTAGAR